MRLCSIVIAAAAAGLAPSAAGACDAVPAGCGPAVVVVPVYTHEGLRLGTIESAVSPPLALELSPYTGQPITVVYDDPGRLPGSIARDVTLVPLPRVPPAHTKAVYPRGY